MNAGGLQGVLAGLAWGMTSTLRTVPATGAPGEPELSVLAGPQAFSLTLDGLDQSGRGGGGGLSFFCCCGPAGVGRGELHAGEAQLGTLLFSEPIAALDCGPSFTPLMRLVKCSKSSWALSCFGFVWVGVFLVVRSGVLGCRTGFHISGGLTGCCLERAT